MGTAIMGPRKGRFDEGVDQSQFEAHNVTEFARTQTIDSMRINGSDTWCVRPYFGCDLICHQWMQSSEFHAVFLDNVLSGFIRSCESFEHEPKTCERRLVELRIGDA